MGSNPSYSSRCGPTCPVEMVSWEDVQEFIRRLNERESGSGYVYRLPTEAEWEYAARAGTTGARYGELDEIASVGVKPVGLRLSNAWGLHDMLGNVLEWVADWDGEYPWRSVTDPQGPGTGSYRVVRGGNYRSAHRGRSTPDHRFRRRGFRLVRTEVDGASGLGADDDHGDTWESPTDIAVGASAQGRIDLVGDEDWFRFRTTAARTWITVAATPYGVTFVELHAGAPPTDGDSAGGGDVHGFRIAAAVPAGTHYLRVGGFGTGDYTLTLQETLDAMEFVRVPAGSFVMGSPADEEGRQDNETQHEVTLSQGFWVGRYEVTQGEWEALMGSNPSHFSECGAQCPVETVSWDDAQEFIRKLNEREAGSGYVYRLPTEAEWEYAARAGTTGPRHGELDEIAWWGGWGYGNSGSRTHPVGQKRPNAWGLHDMLGNVWEWTADLYGDYPRGAVIDPAGPSANEWGYRVYRGGGWGLGAGFVRSAVRFYGWPDGWGHELGVLGFRLVRTD